MSDTLTVYLSGDAWGGDATAVISVNGTQLGGPVDVSAVDSLDNTQAFTFAGSFGQAPVVSVSFDNNACGGQPVQCRNLYLTGFTYDGVPQLGDKYAFTWDQTQTYGLSAAPAIAGRAADLLDATGVNVHLSYFNTAYGNQTVLASALDYLGVTNLRDGVPIPSTLAEMQALSAAGYKFDIIMPEASSPTLLPQQLAGIDAIGFPLAAVEGPNEFNVNAGFSWNGQNGDAAAQAYQQALWDGVQADPNLHQSPVFALTMGGVGWQAYQALGSLVPNVSNGNMHVYYANGTPPYATIQYALALGVMSGPGLPVAITESNYPTAPALNSGVTQPVQMAYDLDTLMDAAQARVPAVYFYELLDENADPAQTNLQNHFGLFAYDGTPKQAATAFHNFNAILADSGQNAKSFAPAALSYSITGLPASGNTFLLQSSDGNYELVIWAEPVLWNAVTQTVVKPTVRVLQVTFSDRQQLVALYDPARGIAPLAQHTHVASVTVRVTDHPVILKITPPPLQVPHNLGGTPGLGLLLLARAGAMRWRRKRRPTLPVPPTPRH